MSVELTQETDGKVLVLNLKGKLTKSDYETFAPAVESAVTEHGKVRMLVRMTDFHGWTTGALWEDIKFDVRHFSDIERIALVGDRTWQAGMAMFCKPFTTAKIRFFDAGEVDEASAWIREGIEQTAGAGRD